MPQSYPPIIDSTPAHQYSHKEYRSSKKKHQHHGQYTSKAAAHYQPQSPPATNYVKSSRAIIELNSADSLDLVQIYNIGPAFARRILKYRALLGGFVDKAQLWEVYGMDSVRFNDIAPYVTVAAEQVEQIDINSATLQQLKRHPYLDYYQAKAIVKTRESEGPYHSVSDLMKISIIDNQTFNHILPYLTCNLPPNK